MQIAEVHPHANGVLYKGENYSFHAFVLMLEEQQNLYRRFKQCAIEWRRDTGHLSNPNVMFDHYAYRQIMDMGKDALPFIFESMAIQMDHWFFALYNIVGEDIAKDTSTVVGAHNAWRNWAIENNLWPEWDLTANAGVA